MYQEFVLDYFLAATSTGCLTAPQNKETVLTYTLLKTVIFTLWFLDSTWILLLPSNSAPETESDSEESDSGAMDYF